MGEETVIIVVVDGVIVIIVGETRGEGWTPREPVGEVDARSWSSPMATQLSSDPAPLTERSRPPGALEGASLLRLAADGFTPPPRVGDALASGGDISLRWCPRYGPREASGS